MNLPRRPPLQHCLVAVFDRAVASLTAALNPETARHYRGTARNFLSYLGADHPHVIALEQLRRDPHVIGWMARLRAQRPPLGTAAYINRLIALRCIFVELAWNEQRPDLAHLIRREDIPRLPQRLPRPLTTDQDQLLRQEFLRRNDLASNAFLLIRHTGMRIGECADLSWDCLRTMGPDHWLIHIPLGKLQTERMVPVDSFVRDLVYRLRFFRFLDPLPADGRLLPRPRAKDTLIHYLRDYLHEVCYSLGLSTTIVPHQFRHTYATEMLRAGVAFPILMKLLGHTCPEMTMRYLDVAVPDLQREFQLARSRPRHLVPKPTAPLTGVRAGIGGVIDSMLAAQHLLEMHRRAFPVGHARVQLDRISNRLSKIVAAVRNLSTP
jgi:integrase